MRVGAVISDLMLYSRIESAASAAGASLVRVDSPTELPNDLDLVLVDWSVRAPGWSSALASWRAGARESRLIVFGPHTDLEAQADARYASLGPMWARSRLVLHLAELLGPDRQKGPR